MSPKITVHGGPSDKSTYLPEQEAVPGEPLPEVPEESYDENSESLPEPDDGQEDYSAWEYADLQAELKNRGLNAKGSTEELQERLVLDDQARQELGEE